MEALQLALKKRQHELLEVAHQAETDLLTGLLNRRAFDDKLRLAFLHTLRHKSSPLSLLYLDLDHFKKINDKFCQQVGDEHLNKLANTLRGIIREDVDLAFRFGGDEFAVVLFADYPLACSKARQVLEAMSNKVSIGITTIDHHTSDFERMRLTAARSPSAKYTPSVSSQVMQCADAKTQILIMLSE